MACDWCSVGAFAHTGWSLNALSDLARNAYTSRHRR